MAFRAGSQARSAATCAGSGRAPFDDCGNRAHALMLLTRNTGEFSRVVGLRVEDWNRAP